MVERSCHGQRGGLVRGGVPPSNQVRGGQRRRRRARFLFLYDVGQSFNGLFVGGLVAARAIAADEIILAVPLDVSLEVDVKRPHLAPHAALLAWEGRDELVAFICGTGASRDTSGRLEADALVDLLFARLPQLREFDCFEHVDLEHLERLLRRTIVADTTSFNTEQECTVALSRLQREGVRRAVLVSSPTHAPRCLRDACAVARQVGFEGTLSVSPCGTSWTELEPVVLEPPHRPDRQPAASSAGAPPPFYELARRAARIAHSRTSDAASDALRDDSFRRALDALLVRHERPEAS